MSRWFAAFGVVIVLGLVGLMVGPQTIADGFRATAFVAAILLLHEKAVAWWYRTPLRREPLFFETIEWILVCTFGVLAGGSIYFHNFTGAADMTSPTYLSFIAVAWGAVCGALVLRSARRFLRWRLASGAFSLLFFAALFASMLQRVG